MPYDISNAGTKVPITALSEKDRHKMLKILHEHNPSPKPALNFNNPFELLCAVVLSAQTTDVAVNQVTGALFKLAPDPLSMSKLSVEEIADIIKRLGLWANKSKHLKALATALVTDYHSQVPKTFDELIKLPGVGAKTANVVLNVAFNIPVIAVDTHIFRVCNRTGLCFGKNALSVQKLLPDLIDDEFKLPAHHLLLLHGRHVCMARKPHCEECIIKDLYVYYKNI